ncbi:MAG: spore maturation protein A [Clostridia bacterium]|nr:spore maturation protein A [Clostridia bacterium]
MMNYIWAFLIILSTICAIFTGNISFLSNAVLSGANDAVSLIISILGMMAFWTGIMKIAEKSKITEYLSNLFSPIIKFIFPDCPPGSPSAKAICMNITANLLGLGNAATPFGIEAMKKLQKNNDSKSTATNSMAMLIVINTASLQLIPTLLCTLRQKHGCANPMEIIPHLWIISAVSLTVGIISTKILEKVK